jgi:hypothetical protein
MGEPSISPEAYLDLKIHLDRLAAAQSKCVSGLGELVSGALSVDEYYGLLNRQRQAHSEWMRRHEKYFGPDER